MRTIYSHGAVALFAATVAYLLVQTGAPSLPAGAAQAVAQVGKPPRKPVAPDLPPPEADMADATPEERVNVLVYQQVNRSVVNITTRSVQQDDFFMLAVPREGSGSGSVLDKQGHILTNHHVIEDARQIAVTLFDGSTHEAKLVGSDPNNELAVIKVETPPDKLYPIRWGDSNKLLVGMRVLALGNPFGLERTLTTGIVSSLNRSLRSENNRLIRGIIQTDAAINPGNSGGPLLNRRGELVGITTAIISRAGQSSGVGMAVPANAARRIVDELIRHGRVIRADAGIFSVFEVDRGLLIARLAPDGPAERAGLRGPEETVVRRGGFVHRRLDRSKADLIVAVDGKAVKSFDDLLTHVESKKPGDRVTLTIVREGKRSEVAITLEEAQN